MSGMGLRGKKKRKRQMCNDLQAVIVRSFTLLPTRAFVVVVVVCLPHAKCVGVHWEYNENSIKI